jgi:hypothetical protein
VEQRAYTVEYEENGEKKTRTEYEYIPHTESKACFSYRFCIYTFPTPYIPSGQYSFPIQFVLPRDIPSTFNQDFQRHGKGYARVKYFMSVEIKSPNMPHIFHYQPFIVNQPGGLLVGRNIKVSHSQEINNCCCISNGTTKMATLFEKSEYYPGEIANLRVEVDNSQCTEDIKCIDAVLRQNLKVTAKGYTDVVVIHSQEHKITGPKKGEVISESDAWPMQVNLKTTSGDPIQQTSQGKLVNNEYYLYCVMHMDVCCQCGEPDPTCKLNINVRNPDIPYSPWTNQPTDWQPQVMTPYTAHS